jgi:hypothetical protein
VEAEKRSGGQFEQVILTAVSTRKLEMRSKEQPDLSAASSHLIWLWRIDLLRSSLTLYKERGVFFPRPAFPTVEFLNAVVNCLGVRRNRARLRRLFLNVSTQTPFHLFYPLQR